MCFPSFPFVTHVLLSPWLTFHLLQVPFLGGRRALAQVGLPKHSLATWNYRAFKAHTSCPSEIHWAYQKAPLPPPKCRMTRFWHICLYWKPLPLFWSTVYWSSLDGGNYLNNKPTKMSPPWIQSCSPDRCQRQHLESIMRQEIKKKRGQKDKQIFFENYPESHEEGEGFLQTGWDFPRRRWVRACLGGLEVGSGVPVVLFTFHQMSKRRAVRGL